MEADANDSKIRNDSSKQPKENHSETATTSNNAHHLSNNVNHYLIEVGDKSYRKFAIEGDEVEEEAIMPDDFVEDEINTSSQCHLVR